MKATKNNMSNDKFVEFCYKTILSRASDQQGKISFTNALKQGFYSREDIYYAFLTSDEYKLKNSLLEFVPSGHFYSSVPSLEDRNRFLTKHQHNDSVLGINLNGDYQLELINILRDYYDEIPFPDNKSERYRYYFLNDSYSYADALTLYCMIRYLKPNKIIEVGSGYSSCVMMDTNDLFFGGRINLTFIEPYPDLLYSLMREDDKNKYRVISKPVQHVDLELFQRLTSNDILFIDSTHVSKLYSDVNKIFFDIFPLLQKNVAIHLHDIFWPFEYPAEWIREGRAWNEIYLLRAFLEFNNSFEIQLFSSYLYSMHYKWLQNNMPLFLKNAGGNLWLKKID